MSRDPRKQRFVTSDKAVKTNRQHEKPCADCPFARAAIPGWLGGNTAEQYSQAAHSEEVIECHTATVQCAGAAIFRSHIHKAPRDKAVLTLPADHARVFSDDGQFLKHHNKNPIGAHMRQNKPTKAEETAWLESHKTASIGKTGPVIFHIHVSFHPEPLYIDPGQSVPEGYYRITEVLTEAQIGIVFQICKQAQSRGELLITLALFFNATGPFTHNGNSVSTDSLTIACMRAWDCTLGDVTENMGN